ncbi:MAG: DUF1667 domain-containing protein [Candidatus Enteromonas sp.]
MAIELTCIVCPRGCRLLVDENLNVTGNSCPRGAAYGKQEIMDPRRTLTSTVRCDSKQFSVCPVKTSGTVPKDKVLDVMKAVNGAVAKTPVHRGDIIVKDIAGTGVDLVATRDLID